MAYVGRCRISRRIASTRATTARSSAVRRPENKYRIGAANAAGQPSRNSPLSFSSTNGAAKRRYAIAAALMVCRWNAIS